MLNMNKCLITIIAILIIAIISISKLYQNSLKENDIISKNNTTLLFKAKTYMFQDSLHVYEIGKLTLKNSELEQYRANDAKLIKDLKLKPAQVNTIVKTKIERKDSIQFVLQKDSCLHYNSKWLQVNGCLGGTLFINSQDSIVQICYKEYKHKFLWWKWGVKGFKQKIINFNPNSQVKYSEWIELRK